MLPQINVYVDCPSQMAIDIALKIFKDKPYRTIVHENGFTTLWFLVAGMYGESRFISSFEEIESLFPKRVLKIESETLKKYRRCFS